MVSTTTATIRPQEMSPCCLFLVKALPLPSVRGGEGQYTPRAKLVVEMAGIEPASREFGRRSATSLVGSFFLARDGLMPTESTASQPIQVFPGFDSPYRHRDYRTPIIWHPLPTHRGKIGWDVAV